MSMSFFFFAFMYLFHAKNTQYKNKILFANSKKFCSVLIAWDYYLYIKRFSFEDFLLCFRHGSCPVFEFLKKSSKKLAGHEREEYGNYFEIVFVPFVMEDLL